MRRTLHTNLRVIDALFVAQGALFWLPIFAMWFSEHVTARQVLWLEAVYYVTVTALEVPTGWGSDRFGRRPMVMLSGLGWALGAAVMASSHGVFGLVVGLVLLAPCRACVSGTDSALLFETLQALEIEEEFPRRIGRAVGLHFATLGLASLVGGWVAGWDLRIPYVLSAMGGLLALLVAFALEEPPIHRNQATRSPSANDPHRTRSLFPP